MLIVLIVAAFAALSVVRWTAAVLAFPLFAAALLFAALKPPVDYDALTQLKGCVPTPPQGETSVPRSLAGLWEYRTGLWSRWRPVNVPSDLAGAFGLSWKARTHLFRRRVELGGAATGKRLFLVFEGVGGRFRVFVNGKPVGGTRAGFSPVEVEITDAAGAASGFTVLVAVTDAHRGNSPLAPGRNGVVIAKGLFRDVRLEARPLVFIKKIHVNADDPANIEAVLILDGSTDEPTAVTAAAVLSTGAEKEIGSVILPPFINGTRCRFSVPKSEIPPWTPGNPALHRLVARAASGEIRHARETTFGWKDAAWESDGLRIGGKTVKLVGVKTMEFLPPYGASAPQWALGRDIRPLREAGFNFLWTEKLPPSEGFLDACDREGMFVACEIPSESAPLDTEELKRHPSFLFTVRTGGRGNVRGDETVPVRLIAGDVAPGMTRPEEVFSVTGGGAGEESSRGARRKKAPPRAGAGNGKPELIVLDYADYSLGAHSRRMRDARRAGFDYEFLPMLMKSGAAGAVLGSLTFAGFRIGIFTETRRPTLSFEVIRQFLIHGTSAAVPPEPAPHETPLALCAVISFIAAAAAIAANPFLGRIFDYPHALLSFTSSYESLGLRFAAAAGVAFALCARLRARPLSTRNLFSFLPLFLSRSLFRNWGVRFAAFLAGFLYLWFAAGFLLSVLTSTPLSSVLTRTAHVSIVEVLTLLLLVPGASAPLVLSGAALTEGVYLLNFAPPAPAAAYAAALFAPAVILFMFHKR
ncbi:MAG: hypothetical protein AB1742_01325 [bacterium]